MGRSTLRKHGNMIEFTHLLVVQKVKDAEMVLRKKGKMCAITSDTPGRDYLKCNNAVTIL